MQARAKHIKAMMWLLVKDKTICKILSADSEATQQVKQIINYALKESNNSPEKASRFVQSLIIRVRSGHKGISQKGLERLAERNGFVGKQAEHFAEETDHVIRVANIQMLTCLGLVREYLQAMKK